MRILLYFVFVVLLSCSMSNMSRAQVEYPDVPYDDAAYSNLAILFVRGVLQEGLEPVFAGRLRPRAMTKYEFAVGLARLLQEIKEQDALDMAPKKHALPPDALICHPQPVTRIREKLAAHPDAADALLHLCRRFGPELEALGLSDWNERLSRRPYSGQPPVVVQPAGVTDKKFDAVTPAFKDLPPEHWAYDAVEKLRRSGIIVGYSDRALISNQTAVR